MSHRLKLLCGSFLLIAILAAHSHAEERSASPVESITIEELRDHMFFLASDELAGRMTASDGYRIAVNYAMTQFRAAGLRSPEAEGGKLYLQPFSLVSWQFGEGNVLTVAAGGQEHELAMGERYVLFRPGELRGDMLAPDPPVFVGYGISEPDDGWDDYENMDVTGKTVLILTGAPTENGKAILPEEKHSLYTSTFRGSIEKVESASERGVRAVIFLPDLQIAMAWGMMRRMATRMNYSYPGSSGVGGDSPVPIVLLHPEATKLIFEGLDYDPLARKGNYRSFVLEDVQLSMRVDVIENEISTDNVIAVVPGTDPELSSQYITVGAHLDHVGERGGTVYNGADDNASGCVAVIEVAEAVAMAPPRRSVVFILYSAEEIGLFGSRFFIENPPVPREGIVVNINLDMIGRGDDQFPEGVYSIGSDRICPELKKILISVNESSVKLPLDFRYDENDPERYFERSDHINFHRLGIPVVCLSSGEHRDYHQPTDDAEKINFDKLQKASQLVYELVMELGNRDEAPCAGH